MFQNKNKSKIALAINQNRLDAIVVGILFIVATITNVIGNSLSKSIFDTANFITVVSSNENQILLGILLVVISAFASAGIAIWLYPTIKKGHEGLALGSVAFRLIEGMLYIGGVINVLLILALGQEYVKTANPDVSWFQILANVLLTNKVMVGELGVIAFTLGGLMYYIVFYQTNIVPRWLTAWGIIAIILTLITALLTIFGLMDSLSVTFIVLNLPLAAQEIVLAILLIIKGFNIPETVSQ